MSETTTRTCDGCGTDLTDDMTPRWELTYVGARDFCQDTSDKHLCTTCAGPMLNQTRRLPG